MTMIHKIKSKVLKLNKSFVTSSEDGYNFWNNHIKYVVNEAKRLAQKYGADLEIVELGALLHDIALISKVGTKSDHHTNGVIIAKEMLNKYKCPVDKTEKVLGCILNHRSSKNATNIEELCVADADILAHFSKPINIFMGGVISNDVSDKKEVIKLMEKDFNDLSEQTKSEFKVKYNKIMKKLFKDLWQ